MVKILRATSGSQYAYYSEFDSAPAGFSNPVIAENRIPFRDFHDRRFAPIGLYQLANNDLTDSSGFNRDLTQVDLDQSGSFGWKAGTLAYEGHSQRSDATFAITGAISVFGLGLADQVSSGLVFMAAYDGGAETEATNFLWGIARNTTGLRYIHEHGAAVNDELDVTSVLEANKWYHIGFTRDTAGTFVRIYLDGLVVGSTTFANAPTGGGSSRLNVGSTDNSANDWNGGLSSVAIFDKELTPAQVKRLYQKVTTGL